MGAKKESDKSRLKKSYEVVRGLSNQLTDTLKKLLLMHRVS